MNEQIIDLSILVASLLLAVFAGVYLYANIKGSKK